jgi:hypothetical protein
MASFRTEDWQAIRAIYENGGLSNRELARRYAPLTEGAIRKRAKKECWARPARARIARPTPIVPRAKPASRVEAWRHKDPLAPCFSPDGIDRASPRAISTGRSPEHTWELIESVGVDLLEGYEILINFRETLLKMVDQYAEDYQISYPRYVRMRKEFSLSTLSAGLRDVSASLEIARSMKAKLARSTR